MQAKHTGFKEVSHTADAALQVWGLTPEELFLSALAGMYQLMGISSTDTQHASQSSFQLSESDWESLLVSFLSECLFLAESEKVILNSEFLSFESFQLKFAFIKVPIIRQQKEIKAVTYHNLKIRQNQGRWETVVVFDL